MGDHIKVERVSDQEMTQLSPASSYASYRSPHENGGTGGHNSSSLSEDSQEEGYSTEEAPLDFSIKREDTSRHHAGNGRGLHHSPPHGGGHHHSPPHGGGHHHSPPHGGGAHHNGGGASPPPPPSPHSTAEQRYRNGHVRAQGSTPPTSPESHGANSPSAGVGAGGETEPRIGEPALGLPGMLPGMTLPPGLLQGLQASGAVPNANMLQGLLPFLIEQQQRHIQNYDHQQEQKKVSPGGKPSRPFKAYPKDPLSLPLGYYGLPGAAPGLPAVDVAAAQALTQTSEETFKQYRDYVIQMQHQNKTVKNPRGGVRPPSQRPPPTLPTLPAMPQLTRLPLPGMHDPNNSISSVSPSSSTGSSNGSMHHHVSPPSSMIPMSAPANSSTSVSPHLITASSTTPTSRKRGRTMPDSQKDEAYWDRRRKNNEAAKRSRDSRRAKEDEIAIRAAFLEQENLKLRVELAALKNETAKLRCMLYNS